MAEAGRTGETTGTGTGPGRGPREAADLYRRDLEVYLSDHADDLAPAAEEGASGSPSETQGRPDLLNQLARRVAQSFYHDWAAAHPDLVAEAAAYANPRGLKGAVTGRIESHPGTGFIVGIGGKSRRGYVCDQAFAVVKARHPHMRPRENIVISPSEVPNCLHVEASGVPGPAWDPRGSDSAVANLVFFLKEGRLVSDDEKLFLEAVAPLVDTVDGSRVGLACSTETLGPLTVAVTGLDNAFGRILVDVDVRFPECTCAGEVADALRRMAARAYGSFELERAQEPFVIGTTPVTSKNIATAVCAYALAAVACAGSAPAAGA